MIPNDDAVRQAVRKIPPAERLCPQSVRDFFGFTFLYFFRSARKFHEVSWFEPRPDRAFNKNHITKSFVERTIVGGKGSLPYGALERVSGLYGVPVSVILLFTRCYAANRDKKDGAEATADFEKLMSFMEKLPDLVQSADQLSDFLKWVDTFHDGKDWRREVEDRLSDDPEYQYKLPLD